MTLPGFEVELPSAMAPPKRNSSSAQKVDLSESAQNLLDDGPDSPDISPVQGALKRAKSRSHGTIAKMSKFVNKAAAKRKMKTTKYNHHNSQEDMADASYSREE